MGLGGKSLHSPAYQAGSRSSSISRYGRGHAHAGEGWGVAARCNWSSWCALSCRTRPEIGHWRSRPRRAFYPRVWKPRPPQTLSVAFANYTGANGLDENKWFFPVRTMRNGPTQSCGNAEPRYLLVSPRGSPTHILPTFDNHVAVAEATYGIEATCGIEVYFLFCCLLISVVVARELHRVDFSEVLALHWLDSTISCLKPQPWVATDHRTLRL